MQIQISKEIRGYEERIVWGLTLRQLFCCVMAVGAAVLVYFGLKDRLGTEATSWVCMVCAGPLVGFGFFTYDNLTMEKVLKNILYTEIQCAKPRLWRVENEFERKMKEVNRSGAKKHCIPSPHMGQQKGAEIRAEKHSG